MHLSEVSVVVGVDIDNAPFVNFAGRNVACGDQIPQPLGGVSVKLVIDRPLRHHSPANRSSGASAFSAIAGASCLAKASASATAAVAP